MKKVLKITAIVIVSLIVILLVAFEVYWHNNMHWYDKYQKALDKVGAEEKQFTLPNGNIINYGEVKNDKPTLLLIHGQMSVWEDYALVMPELCKDWHIYAVDVCGLLHRHTSYCQSLPGTRRFPCRDS